MTTKQEKPQEGDWEREFDSEFAGMSDEQWEFSHENLLKDIKTFLRQIIQAEREKAYIQGQNDKENNEKFMARGAKAERSRIVEKVLNNHFCCKYQTVNPKDFCDDCIKLTSSLITRIKE